MRLLLTFSGIFNVQLQSTQSDLVLSWSENQGILFFIYFSNIFNELDIFHGFTN